MNADWLKRKITFTTLSDSDSNNHVEVIRIVNKREMIMGDNFKKLMRACLIILSHSPKNAVRLVIEYVATSGITNMNIQPPYLVENASPPSRDAIRNLLKEYFSTNLMQRKIVARINVCSSGFGRTCVLHIRNWGIVRKHSVPIKAIMLDPNSFLDMVNNMIPLMEAENILINLQVTKIILLSSPKKYEYGYRNNPAVL